MACPLFGAQAIILTNLGFLFIRALQKILVQYYWKYAIFHAIKCILRPGTPVLEVIFNKYLIFEFSTGNSFLLLGL